MISGLDHIAGIWKDHWIYWAGPLSGSALATFMYVFIFDNIDKPMPSNNTSDMYDLNMKGK